jgi:hypothetical protein
LNTLASIRALVIVMIFAAFVALTSVRCVAHSKTRPEALSGYLAVVKGVAASSDRGDLALISLSDNSLTTIAHSVAASDTPTYSLASNSVIATKYVDTSTEITSYSIGVASEQNLTEGRGPSVRGDKLAFCDLDGRLAVMDFNTRTTSVVAELRSFASCIPFAWSHDGRLAFIAHSPLGATAPAPVGLFIRDANGDLREMPVSEAEFGATAVSWSNDDSYIAVSADHRQIVVKASSTGATVFTLTGDRAQYAADAPELAVLQYSTSDTDAVVAIYDGSRQTRTRSLGRVRRLGFDWIAGGEALALTLDDSFGVWRLGDDALSKTQIDGKLFSNIRFVPQR